MPSNDPGLYLSEIVANIDLIRSFTVDLSFDEYAADHKTVYAVFRALEIISEASRRIPDDIKARRSDIDWHGMAAFGNVLRHTYRDVEHRVVWDIVQRDLMPLRRIASTELAALSGPQS